MLWTQVLGLLTIFSYFVIPTFHCVTCLTVLLLSWWAEYLVFFQEYWPTDDHDPLIASILLGTGADSHQDGIQLFSTNDWMHVPRDEASLAHRFPSDFATLKTFNNSGAVLSALESHMLVKRVFPQRRLTLALQDFDDEEDGASDEPVLETSYFDEATGELVTLHNFHRHDSRTMAPPSFQRFDDGGYRKDGDYNIPGGEGDATRWGNLTDPDVLHARKLAAHLKGTNSGKSQRVAHTFGADKIWEAGHRGNGVKVGVFDTGIKKNHPSIKKIKERSNWTSDKTLDDTIGHGTFCAGVIASTDEACPGFAPEVEIYTFRVFTSKQVSYSSWFLDAFNYAIHTHINIINLSIGGPDFKDQPFVEKVWELSANNIILVSAIGNDGPQYGTLNNPADQPDVIGVGGISNEEHIATFSSRGMTTWELPHGFGRIKPDVVAYGQNVRGAKMQGGCRDLSGTSVSSPVVAGAVALLASTVPEKERWGLLNPASMKQLLVESADVLPGHRAVEQGMGRLNLLSAYDMLREQKFKPHASVIPPELDLRAKNCPFMWPLCAQPMYPGAMPVMANLTILNGMGLVGTVEDAMWVPGNNGHLVNMHVDYSDIIWPWTGYMAVYMTINEDPSLVHDPSKRRPSPIVARGELVFTVKTMASSMASGVLESEVRVPITVEVVPTPPKEKRILWDQFHSLRYPSAYVPKDSLLSLSSELLDWNADHLYTNFHKLFTELVRLGYSVEVLGGDYTCFDALQYGTLLLVDMEDEYMAEEILKVREDVLVHGLSVVVFAEWYDKELLRVVEFFDESTRSNWHPITGGGNVPALNDLLKPFGIAFGGRVFTGDFKQAHTGEKTKFSSGNHLSQFPAGGYLYPMKGKRLKDQSKELYARETSLRQKKLKELDAQPVLGAVDTSEIDGVQGGGRVVVFGDSGCLDTAFSKEPGKPCWGLLKDILEYAMTGRQEVQMTKSPNPNLFPDDAWLDKDWNDGEALPTRDDQSDRELQKVSHVFGDVKAGDTCWGNHVVQL
jgi:membrane-bound transcription factor site-1 protease